MTIATNEESNPPSQSSRESISGPLPEALWRRFTNLGLSPYEGRVLLALLCLGSANTLKLAQLSRVPRTSTYQALDALNAKGLAERLPGTGPAVWACPSRDQVFEQLEACLSAAQAEQLEQHRTCATQLREMLAQAVPEAPSVSLPCAHLIRGTAALERHYERLWAEVRSEVLLFLRPPWSTVPDLRPLKPVVVDTLRRPGVKARVLYQAAEGEDGEAEALRQGIDTYRAAGAEVRVVDELSMKLAVFDRTAAVVAMPASDLPQACFPTTLLVEHPAFAGAQAALFDHYWASARPYAPSGTPSDRPGTPTSPDEPERG